MIGRFTFRTHRVSALLHCASLLTVAITPAGGYATGSSYVSLLASPWTDPPPPPPPPEPGPRPVPTLWPANGAAICEAPGDQTELRGTNDHAHGAYFAWRDRRAGESDIYAIRLGPDGRPVGSWEQNGTLICGASGEQRNPVIVTDGTWGTLIAWIDERGAGSALYVQRVEPNGQISPGWPVNGRKVGTITVTAHDPSASLQGWADLMGGVMLLWSEGGGSEKGYLPLTGEGLSASGVESDSGWTVFQGSVSSGGCQWNEAFFLSAFPVWPSRLAFSWGFRGVHCQEGPCIACLSFDALRMVVLDSRGAHVGSNGWHGSWSRLGDDGVGGMYRTDHALVTRMGAYGHPNWQRAFPYSIDRLLWNGDGHLVLSWGPDSVVQRVLRVRDDSQNATGWTDNNGVPVCLSCGTGSTQVRPEIADDGHSGVFLLWRDRRFGSTDLYANWIRGDAMYGWSPTGVSIARTVDDETSVGLIANGKGDAIAFWQDSRHGDSDLWGYRLSTDSPVSTSASIVSAEATEGRVVIAWHVARGLPRLEIHRRESDSAWRVLTHVAPDASSIVRIEDDDVLPGFRYDYRLVHDGGILGAVTIEVPRTAFRFDGAAPNPSDGELSIRFQLPRAGSAGLTVTDVAGRVVLRRALEGLAAGPHHMRIADPGTLAPGVYVVRLEFAGAALTRRVVMIP